MTTRSNGRSIELIQAARLTESRQRSDSDLARVVASHRHWQFEHDDQVCDPQGMLSAFSIEDLAVNGSDAGWFAPDNAGIMQRVVDVHNALAVTVGSGLDRRRFV